MKSIKACAISAIASLLLVACATPQPSLYAWGSYQNQVYAHFKAEKSTPEAELAALEKDREAAEAKGLTLPPGFRAHLGYLYLSQGKLDEAQQQFLAEKKAFPESAVYMDFLLKTPKKDQK